MSFLSENTEPWLAHTAHRKRQKCKAIYFTRSQCAQYREDVCKQLNDVEKAAFEAMRAFSKHREINRSQDRHCEERGDEAIHALLSGACPWIASLRSQ